MLVVGKFAWVPYLNLPVKCPWYSGKFRCACRQFASFLREMLATLTQVNLPVFTGKVRVGPFHLRTAGKVTCVCRQFCTRQFYSAFWPANRSIFYSWTPTIAILGVAIVRRQIFLYHQKAKLFKKIWLFDFHLLKSRLKIFKFDPSR